MLDQTFSLHVNIFSSYSVPRRCFSPFPISHPIFVFLFALYMRQRRTSLPPGGICPFGAPENRGRFSRKGRRGGRPSPFHPPTPLSLSSPGRTAKHRPSPPCSSLCVKVPEMAEGPLSLGWCADIVHSSVRLGASHRGGKCTPPSWCRPYLSPAKATLLPHHPFLWLFFMQLPLPFLQRRFWKMLSKKRGVTSENSTAFLLSLSQKQEPPYFRLHSDPLSLDNKVAGTEPINSHVLLPASQRQNISWTLRRPEPQTFPFFGRSLPVISGALVFSEKSPLPPLHLLPLFF